MEIIGEKRSTKIRKRKTDLQKKVGGCLLSCMSHVIRRERAVFQLRTIPTGRLLKAHEMQHIVHLYSQPQLDENGNL